MTVAQYPSEYIEFIKNTLVNQCIIEYKRAVFENSNNNEIDYVESLFQSLSNKNIWQIIFKKLDPIFNFYTDLEYNYIEEDHRKNVFKLKTFQHYIDSLVNLKTVGPTDYQSFIKNMQNADFRNKMIIKYNIDRRRRLLMNHLIFIVELHIMEIIGQITYESNYSEFLPTIINAIPYYEYLSEKGWTIHNIENDSLYEESSNAGERTELKALKQIQNRLFA
jgi:hypothetical protein